LKAPVVEYRNKKMMGAVGWDSVDVWMRSFVKYLPSSTFHGLASTVNKIQFRSVL